VNLCGIITAIRKQFTKKNELMYYLMFEDLTGAMEVIVFPSQVRAFYNLLKEDAVLCLSGNLDMPEDKPPKLRIENVAPISAMSMTAEKYKKLYIKMKSYETEKLAELKEILTGGNIPVNIYYEDTKQAFAAPKTMWADEGKIPYDALYEIFEESDIKLVEK